jgi:hypothetical protein
MKILRRLTAGVGVAAAVSAGAVAVSAPAGAVTVSSVGGTATVFVAADEVAPFGNWYPAGAPGDKCAEINAIVNAQRQAQGISQGLTQHECINMMNRCRYDVGVTSQVVKVFADNRYTCYSSQTDPNTQTMVSALQQIAAALG